MAGEVLGRRGGATVGAEVMRAEEHLRGRESEGAEVRVRVGIDGTRGVRRVCDVFAYSGKRRVMDTWAANDTWTPLVFARSFLRGRALTTG